MQHVRWGILGAAKFAREHMGPAIHMATGAELVAVASSDAQKVAPFQDMAPRVRAESYEGLLAADDIDAVYIPLPNHLHLEWAERALAAGKHVLVEKPATMSATDHEKLIAARDQSGLLAAEAYMIVHHPQWTRVRYLVQDGAIGQLIHVSGAFTYNNPSADNIRNDAGKGGGGLPDIGVYILGSARFATGEELAVTSARLRMEGGVDVFAEVTGKLGPVSYSAYCGMRAHLCQEMAFHGTEGRIKLLAPFNPGIYADAVIEIDQPNQGKRLERYTGVNQYKLQVEAFGRSIREGAAYPCPLEFTRGTQAAIDQAYAVGEVL